MKIYKIAEDYKRYYTPEIAVNSNTSPEILKKILEIGNNDEVSMFAARNPNCPPEALEMVLKRGMNDWVSKHAAHNINCPSYLLEMVLKRGIDNAVSWIAAKNPNCPVQALEMILKRGKDDWASYNAVQNPNCPLKAKINWMQATGKIGKEDPSKHIIEREEVKEDEDLKKLRALISKNNSWYKTSQEIEEDYYTEKIAENFHTSPDILRKILEKGNNDNVSCFAAQNPNCPASALEMILKRGNNDSVSHYAAINPNCPPQALVEVLKQGNNDYVSYYAAKNPNCPALAKIRWMQATGKIEQEDPTKHIIEREEYKEDEDLKKLRALISKNNSWYKKAQAELLELDDLPNIEDDSEDEDAERAKKYFGIGHGDFVEEFGYNPDFLIWIMIDGHIEKSKVFKVNQESGEAKGAQTHGSLWGNARDDNYKGRYEPQTGRLTLVKPENVRFREVPKEIINRVKNSFPKAKQIIIASNKNMYKVAKEEDVDLYLSREITRLGLDHPIFRQIPLYDIKDWLMRNDPELEKASSKSIDKIYEDYLREHPESLQKPKQMIPVPSDRLKLYDRAFLR